MRISKEKSPNPTDLIDWINDEGLLDLEWDFPVDGDLYEAGLDDAALVDLAAAIEERFDIELSAEELKKGKVTTPQQLVKTIASKLD